MAKSTKIALIQQLLLDIPRSAIAAVRVKESQSLPIDERLTAQEWETLLTWLDEVKPRRE